MSDTEKQKKKLSSRRQLLKASIIGTGAVVAGKSLPDQWARPVVESVILPTHAQTSLTSITGGLILSVASLDDSILDTLVPTAHAESESVTGVVCFDLNGDDTVDVRALITYSAFFPPEKCDIVDVAYFTGTVNQGEETKLTLMNGACFFPETAASIVVKINGGVASGIFEYHNIESDAGSKFGVSDPGCTITKIPEQCDQETCLL